MSFFITKYGIPLWGIIFWALIIVLGSLNTWNLIALQWKVQWLSQHRLPASLAFEDWTFAPTLAIEAKTKPISK